MKVERISTARGSHIEPPLDDSWSLMKQLTWCAACTSIDTGLEVRVSEAPSRFYSPMFFIQIGRTSISSKRFADAWQYLGAVSVGAREARRLLHMPLLDD